MIRALLPLLLLSGCYTGLRLGESGAIGAGNGGAGTDVTLAFGGEHRGERVRASGGLQTGGHLGDKDGFIPVGALGSVDVGLTEPNRKGGRLIGTAQLSLGFARGVAIAASTPTPPDGTYAQLFLGLGFGGTSSPVPRNLEAGHATLGLLVTRFSPDGRPGYWIVGGALSFSLGLNLGEISAAVSGGN